MKNKTYFLEYITIADLIATEMAFIFEAFYPLIYKKYSFFKTIK